MSRERRRTSLRAKAERPRPTPVMRSNVLRDMPMPLTRRVSLHLLAPRLRSTLRAQSGGWTLESGAAGLKTLKDQRARRAGYLTGKPAGVPLEGNSACCIHPFNTVGGECATDIAPPITATTAGSSSRGTDMTFTRAAARPCAATSGAGDSSRRSRIGSS